MEDTLFLGATLFVERLAGARRFAGFVVVFLVFFLTVPFSFFAARSSAFIRLDCCIV